MKELHLSTKYRRKILECGYTIASEGFFHPDRVMHEFVLVYMIAGSMDVYIGDELYHLTENDIVLMPPRMRHYGPSKCSAGMKNMYLHFCPVSGDLKEEGALTVPMHLHIHHVEDISHRFRDIIHTFYSCHSANRDLLLSGQLEVLLALLSDYESSYARSDTMPPLITAVLSLLAESPDRFYSQAELAEHFGVSVRTLTDRFREATNTTLHAWQVDYKLALIHDALRYDSCRTLHNLAESYGFYDEFQLSKLYKKKYGVSPKHGRISSTHKPSSG